MVRKITVVLVIIGLLLIPVSACAFLVSSAVLGTAAAITGGASVASALTIFLARFGLKDIIEGLVQGEAARQAEYQRIMDFIKDKMEQSPDPDFGNQFQRWKNWSDLAFTGATRFSLTPQMIKPIADVFESEYNLTGDMRYWLASKTAGFMISNQYMTVNNPPSWVSDLVPDAKALVARGSSALVNFAGAAPTNTSLYSLYMSNDNRWKIGGVFVSGTNGHMWYRWDNYHVYVYSDRDLAYIVRDRVVSNSWDRFYLAWVDANYGSGNLLIVSKDDFLDSEKEKTTLDYLTEFFTGCRLAAAFKMSSQAYTVKKVVATVSQGYNPMILPVPDIIPFSETDPDFSPVTEVNTESDLVDRAVMVFNNVDDFNNKYNMSDRTLQDVYNNPTGTFEIAQALGSVKFENGSPVSWYVNGVQWATINSSGDVIFNGDKIGSYAGGAINLNPVNQDYDTYYSLGPALLLTQDAQTMYCGNVPVGSRVGDAVSLFGHNYVADSRGIQVGDVKLISNQLPGTVVVNTLDLQVLNNNLVNMVSQLQNVKTALDQGTSINHQVLTNTQTLLNSMSNVETALQQGVQVDLQPVTDSLATVQTNTEDIIQMLEETGGASVSVDLGKIEGLLEGEFAQTEEMREEHIKPTIEDIARELDVQSIGHLPDASVWKKLFWFDIPSITAAAETLKNTAAEHFPFSIFGVLSGVQLNITEETETIPLILNFGPYGGQMSFDWQSDDTWTEFQSVTRPISTIIIWLYFIGFLASLRPKAAID